MKKITVIETVGGKAERKEAVVNGQQTVAQVLTTLGYIWITLNYETIL